MKEWLYRALRTFLQAFVGTVGMLLVSVMNGIDFGDAGWGKAILIGLICPALSAGLAAVMNMGKKEDVTEKDETKQK